MRNKKKNSEKGVALIFALGILGLMTVLALTFASTAMTNQAVATAALNGTKAHELASSLIDRIQSQLTNSITTPAQLHSLYSRGTGANESTYDWIWRLALRDNSLNAAIYSMDVIDYTNVNVDNLPTWEYITYNDSIKARLAYTAVAYYLPVLDFSALVLNEDNSSTSLGGNYVYKGISLSGEVNPLNLMQEINQDTNINWPDYMLNIPAKIAGNASKRISTFTRLSNLIDLNELNKKNFYSQFVKTFTTTPTKYPEAFHLPDDIEKNPKLYHRYDLRTLTKFFSNTPNFETRKAFVSQLGYDDPSSPLPQEFSYTEAVDYDSNILPYIPWFKEFNDPNFVGFANVETKKRQIIANFIDFFAPSESPVTSDVNPNEWMTATTQPTYTGLKKTPQISAFASFFILNVSATANDDGDYEIEITPGLRPYIEFTSMFKDLTSAQYIATLAGTLTFDASVTLADGTPSSLTFSYDFNNTTKDFSFEGSKKEYFYLGGTDSTSETDIVLNSQTINTRQKTAPQKSTINISNAHVNLKLLLQKKDSGQPVDISYLTTKFSQTLALTEDSGKTNYFSLVIRPPDPRHNLTSEMWSCSNLAELDSSTVPNYNTAMSTLSYTPAAGEVEIGYNDIFNIDPDHTGTSWSLSPRWYIREKAVDDNFSPSELSYIHRAAPWQTLHFSKYAITETKTPDSTGEDKVTARKLNYDYSSGDLALLDQLKLTTQNFSYGKIPLNQLDSGNIIALIAIMKDSYVDGLPDAATTRTSPTGWNTSTILDNAKAYIEKLKATEPYYFKNKLEITRPVGASGSQTNSFFTTFSDEVLDTWLPDLVFLFDAEPTFLPKKVYLYGVAQSIEETKKSSVEKNWGTSSDIRMYAAGYSFYVEDTGWQNITGATVPSSSINSTQGVYNNGADSITGTETVFAVLERDYTLTSYDDTTNKPKWKVIEVKYAE